MSKPKGSPRKFAEKIALLNKKEAEHNAEFEKIIKEVEETTRAPFSSRTSSMSSWNGERPQIEEQFHPQQASFDTYSHHQQCPPLNQQHNDAQVHTQQHLQLNLPVDPMSIQTPEGVPNIEIFPIQDDNNYDQQQATSNNYQTRNDCSNSINAARSLPDIANLRVSGSFTQLPPSYSDQRISQAGYDYRFYDTTTNSNVVTDLNARPYCFQNTIQGDQDNSTLHYLEDSNNQRVWQNSNFNNMIPSNSLPRQQPQQVSIARANSTNAVLGSWTNSESLNAPRTVLNGTLSKSSEGCYNYLDNHQGMSLNTFSDEGRTVGASIMRSSSYNNIENIDFQQGDGKNASYLNQDQQVLFQTNQFYE